ncbi:hypothetical protein DL769_002008 [Monosporascus sp. CRB-8-3]|nr:hypothetical protein DL769_002008 [Monosporascus sp. CRB-8-3]
MADVPGGFPGTPPVTSFQESPPGTQSPLVEPSNWISARRSAQGGGSAIASGLHDIGGGPSLHSGIRADDETNASGTRQHSHTTAARPGNKRPTFEEGDSSVTTEEDLFRVTSRRRSSFSRAESKEEQDEIERLISRLFGEARERQSEEEKARHAGVIFRDLTVKGVGLGASLQPTVGDIFLGLPRFLKNLFTKGPKTFCNQRAGFEDVLGDVTYGGTDAKTMAKDFRGEIIYNPEDDLHYATLTVRHTLSFALQTRTPGNESRMEGESRKDYVKEFLRVATKLLWIEHTLDTKVGNEYIRGVSGGERKRSLRALTNMANISTAVSLYQAGESLYNLADKVLLIDSGRCLYYGTTDRAKQYFHDLGFDCPDRWTTADFLTSVTDPFERSVKPGWENRIPRSAQDFADVYMRSDAYQRNLDDVRVHGSNRETVPCHVGRRGFFVWQMGRYYFQGLVVGSSFYDLPDSTAGAFTRGGVLFLILLFNALLALAELTAAFESKPILLRHKNFSFYRPSAYALAQTVVDIPLVLVQVVLFAVIIYWMAGLSATPSQFFISILILWLVTMTTYAFFRAISAVLETLDDATKVTGVAIQILIVYTGYLIPPSQMRPWFGWLRWINWIQYGFECLMSNEFYRLQ